MKKLIVATRKSQLALAQARAWMRALTAATRVPTEELHVVTTGDRVQDVALSQIGGKGLFIKEIEEALVDGRADVAVHSMKDVPAELAPNLVIGCVPVREDPRDVVVTREGCRFEELCAGATVGTSSLRRMSMLRSSRPDLSYVPIRGNVDTRLRKCSEGIVDAVVLARAGLVRLGIEPKGAELIDPSLCLPAIGQGALAVEQRASDAQTRELIACLAHAETWIAVAAERGVMTAVEGSCQMPVAAYGVRDAGGLFLRGMLAEPDGSGARFRELRVPWPSSVEEATLLGIELGRELKGA